MDQISILTLAVNELKDKINCPICFDTLSDSVLTKCKHHFCSECYKKLFEGRGSQRCPVCHTTITRRSCVKNVGSLNKIIQAANELIKNLVEDSGIDFSRETITPHSSREAIYSKEIIKESDNQTKLKTNIRNHEKEKNNAVAIKKKVKQYHGINTPVNIEDSFMFPADFICPKKVPEIKRTESLSKKVTTWLTENEKNLKEDDDFSILNGSLPKKPHIADLSVSSSEEELFSVSQLDTNSNSHLAPLKYKIDLDVINEHPENDSKGEAEPPEFKDPYEFISSQKSNQARTLKKTLKRNSKSYGNKRKPLGLDISHLVNEPYVKKKKLEVYDASFQIPTAINDTFDQLLSSNKPSQFTTTGKKENMTKHSEDKKKKLENNVLIFVSQNDPASQKSQTTLSDFSSGSDDEWAPSKNKREQKVTLIKSEKPKPKFQKRMSTRKSIGITAKKMKNEEDKQIIDNMNKTFQEIENHNLVTSSQVMREEVARKESVKYNESKNNSNSEKERKDDNHRIDEIMSPVKRTECANKDVAEHSNSPGWSRANHFKKELSYDVHPKQHSSANKQKDKALRSHHSNVNSKKLKVVIEETQGNRPNSKNTFYSKETPLCPEKDSFSIEKGNVQDKECIRMAYHKHSPVRPEPIINLSSPEEPVKYLNLSQSEERAAIMNSVVKAFESSLRADEKEMHLASPADSRICVSIVNLPDEDENILENCIETSSVRRKLITEKWDQCSSDLNTPVSVVMTCNTNENGNDPSNADTRTSVHISENTDAAIKNMKDESEIHSTKLNKILQDSNNKHKSSILQDKDDLELQIMAKNMVELKTDLPLNNNNLALGEGMRSRDELLCGTSNQAIEKEIKVLKKYGEINQNEERAEIMADEKICKENFKKGILIVKPATVNPEIEKNETGRLKEVICSGRSGRKVHFSKMSTEQQSSLQLPCGQGVVFLKAGSCSSRYFRPRVRFLYLGSCKNDIKKQWEDHWIIKVSKTLPLCHCGNNSVVSNFCESFKLQQINSTSEQDEMRDFVPQNRQSKIPFCQNKKNEVISNENSETEMILSQMAEKIPINNLEFSKKVNDYKESDKFSNVSKIILSQNVDKGVKNMKSCSNSNNNNNKENCKSSVVEAQIHIENSTSQDRLFEINKNCSTNSNQKLNEKFKTATNDSLGAPFKVSYGNNSNSNSLLEKLNNTVAQNSMQEVKPDSNTDQSPSSSQSSQKKISDEDIFKSYPNNNMAELPLQKDTEKVSGDIFASEECGVLPYQEPCKNASENIKSEILLPQKPEKSDTDTCSTHQNVSNQMLLKKTSVSQKINQNSNVYIDEDIFQTDDLTNCLVPPFQENCTSRIMGEMSQNSMNSGTNINDTSKNCLKRQLKLSIEDNSREIVRAHPSSKKCNLGKSSYDMLTSDINIHGNSKDVFKTEERNNRSQSPVQKSPRKINHENMSEVILKLNHNNLVKDDLQLDEDTSLEHKISSINKPSPKNRKRVRPLEDSSGESDSDEKIAKKSSTNPSPANSLKQSVDHNLPVNNNSGHSKNDVLKNYSNTEDADYLLNSEELLQKVIDNINEDLGIPSKSLPKLRGAKTRILSDSEDDLGYRKLSKSPEYEEQEIINLDDDDDVFEDNGDSDADIIEGTPKENGTNELSIKQLSPKRISVSGNVKKIDVQKDTPNPVSRKFVLPLSSNSNTKNNSGSGNVVLDPVKKPEYSTGHLEEDSNRKATLTKMKESTVIPNLFDVPQKLCVESTGKKALNTHLGNSQRKENGIQKSDSDIVHKALPTVSKHHPPSRRKMVFVCSGLAVRFVTLVKKFANDIGAGFSDNFSMSMTHLIVNVDENQATPKTLKYLMAVAAKKWVVSFNWITACITAKRILPEEDFEAIDTVGLDGPRRSRLSSESLLKNVQACFIEPFKSITVDKLQEIFMMCGGMVIDSPEGFSIVNNEVFRVIIVDNDAEVDASLCFKWMTRNRAITLHYDWLVDCIGTHSILPLPSSYAVPFTREQVLACGIPEQLLEEEDMEVTGVSDIGSQPEP